MKIAESRYLREFCHLDYYLHNSTFITPPEGWDKYVKQKEKASRMGGFRNGSGSAEEFFWGYLTMNSDLTI